MCRSVLRALVLRHALPFNAEIYSFLFYFKLSLSMRTQLNLLSLLKKTTAAIKPKTFLLYRKEKLVKTEHPVKMWFVVSKSTPEEAGSHGPSPLAAGDADGYCLSVGHAAGCYCISRLHHSQERNRR